MYFSPVIDLFNGEILSYAVDTHPHYALVETMWTKLMNKLELGSKKIVLHSDQGCQYRIPKYKQKLKENGITQSMSRKGDCYDNACIENFFGLLKSEFYYLIDHIESIDSFIASLDKYIS
ncbi:DDE-type integrase/transposase/recombinase [Enterococcus villorum]|uniref:DDE-type integrase/transposase/recombinase n=1 Tax=Enterococcus villorum TaxID=112904 RepID=UPI0009C113B8|nr:DDE-type integrase/transposase/recombinase [Enterococcus villorum]